jgi:hypothetical protein
MIGLLGSPFSGVLGNPNAVLHQAFFYMARIIKLSTMR